MDGKCGYFLVRWQYSVQRFWWIINLWSINSNLCFGRAFKILLKRPNQQKVCSHMTVLPSGSFSFNILGLKSLWQLSLLWLWRWILSIILIRFSVHKFANDFKFHVAKVTYNIICQKILFTTANYIFIFLLSNIEIAV